MSIRKSGLTALFAGAMAIGLFHSPALADDQPYQVADLSISIFGGGIHIGRPHYGSRYYRDRHYRHRGKRYHRNRHYRHSGKHYRKRHYKGRLRYGHGYVDRDGSSCMRGGCYASGK